jgi:hypothetical protein
VAAAGAEVTVTLDGVEVARRTLPPGPPQHDPNTWAEPPPPLSIPFATGRHVLGLASTGPEWFRLRSITFPGLGPAITAHSIGSHDFALARLTSTTGAPPARCEVRIEGLADGGYALTMLDLDSGRETASKAAVVDGMLRDVVLPAADVVLLLRRLD